MGHCAVESMILGDTCKTAARFDRDQEQARASKPRIMTLGDLRP
jgi:hypothetical protein